MSQYATATDFEQLGLPARALAGVSAGVINDTLTKASATIDSYLRANYTLPLAAPYPDEVIWCCACIAAYRLLTWRGYNPDEHDSELRLRYEDCIAWLKDLATGKAHLAIDADATPATGSGPKVQTSTLRGW